MCKKLSLLCAEYADKAATKWNPILAGRTSEILSKYVATPVKVDGSPRLSGIMDSINATRGNDLPLPADLLDEGLLETMHEAVVEEWFGGYLQDATYRRLGAGRLLGDLRDQIVGRATGKDNAGIKVALFGAHDTTLGALLASVGAFDHKWPPFTSHIEIETFESLHKDGIMARILGRKDHFVRVKYNDRIMSLPACANRELCTLAEFTRLVDTLVPQDWQEECRVGDIAAD